MQSDRQHITDEPRTWFDTFNLWLFILGSIFCIGLGIWGLFFKV